MAKHEVVIHENTGATKDEAPYLGSYIAKETVKEGVFANSIALLCGMSAVQVTAILDGAFEAIEELERGGLVRVHTDIGNGFLYAVDARTKMRIKDSTELKSGDVIRIVSTAK